MLLCSEIHIFILILYNLDQGFCDHELNFQSPDNRGSYNWSETEVGMTNEVQCFYDSMLSMETEMAVRKCNSRNVWTGTGASSYDGMECLTMNSYQLRLISKVGEVQVYSLH